MVTLVVEAELLKDKSEGDTFFCFSSTRSITSTFSLGTSNVWESKVAPAFSLIKKGGGSTFAIYPKSDLKAFKQVEKLREDNRVDMYAEADYSEGTTTYMWIMSKIQELAQNIVDEEKSRLAASISDSPKHLN